MKTYEDLANPVKVIGEHVKTQVDLATRGYSIESTDDGGFKVQARVGSNRKIPPIAAAATRANEGSLVLDISREDEFLPVLDAACLRDGVLQVMPASFYLGLDPNDLGVWCLRRGFYSLPTLELVEFLKGLIGSDSAIEIGAGHGALGRALGIPMTDSHMLGRDDVAEMYRATGQEVATYPADVEKLTALEACEKYRPRVVLGAWITHRYSPDRKDRGGNSYGVDESRMLSKGYLRRYIMVGHDRVHRLKPLLDRRHETHRPMGLVSRSPDREKNAVWVWSRSQK